jgi:Flp pilus assembly protein TadB
MDSLQLAGIIVCVFAFGGMGVLFLNLTRGSAVGRQSAAELRGLMGNSPTAGLSARSRRASADDDDDDDQLVDIESIKKKSGSSVAKKTETDVNAKLFQAGIYSNEEKRKFQLARIICPGACAVIFGLAGLIFLGSAMHTSLGILGGAFVGFALPLSWLERKIRARQEMTLYFLPLVIEQIAIGVSSSLDIGPCLSMLVNMATERESHNPVSEMFIHAEKLMRSGLNLEESLVEVAEANGQHEIKHAFLFLAQCSKHGGEISKQLQELADAVMTQRQVQVEAKIAQLPVKATGPLGCVFAGFFGLLFAGLVVRLMEAFGS